VNAICRLVAVLACLTVFALAQPARTPAENHMADNVQRALAHIDAFEKNRDADELREATNILTSTDISLAPSSQERMGLRHAVFHAWLRLLNLLDATLDPAFQPAAKPALGQLPPGEAGLPYASGTKPEDIKDPVLRKKYEESIEKNRQKSAAYGLQVKLRRVNETATPNVERYIRQFYSTASLDQKELHEDISKAIKNPKRAEQLIQAGKPKP
jgi:hypothetical protein